MADSSGRPEVPGPSDADQVAPPADPPGAVAPPRLPTEVASQNLPTEVAPHAGTEVATPHTQTAPAAPHPPTENARPAQADVAPPHRPTEMAVPYPQTEAAGRGSGVPAQDERTAGPGVGGGQPADIVRHGPGVPVLAPAGQTGPTAEQVWRTGRLPEPPRRPRRLRRVAGGALTMILLAAAGVVLYLRFHHTPLQVKDVAIARQVTNGCAVDVTGRIATNGSAGTVTYQWLLLPQFQAPQPMSQSVVAGQDALYVTVALQGQDHGSVARAVTLQVLGPGAGTAVTHVVVSC